MRRLFGNSKNKEPVPTLADATDRVNSRGDALDAKINALDQQLNELKSQMAKLRDGPRKTQLRQRALSVLKQRKMYEQQRGALYGQAFNMEQAAFAQESVKDSITQVQAMKECTKQLKTQMKQIKISDVDNMRDEMDDLLEDHYDIQEALSRSYAGMDEIDDDELDAELAALDDELLGEEEAGELPSYLQDTPAIPSAVPAGRNPASADAVDEFGLPAVPVR